MGTTDLIFREAEGVEDMEQIHRLNHRVFAEEIGQHRAEASGLLVDRFYGRNRYFVGVRNRTVVGMVSANEGPEFSVTRRLSDADVLQQFQRPLEVRLLAVSPEQRSGTLLAGLLWQVFEYALIQGFSHLLISGIAEREGMYRKLGFRPLGPAVVEGAASFVPMVMPIEEQMRRNGRRVAMHERRWRGRTSASTPLSLMPGPVCISAQVTAAFRREPVSHRAPSFVAEFEQVRRRLSGLMAGLELALFPGAGTLANDVVAANLKAIFGAEEGLVLSNGEFGERLARQAASAGLSFRHQRFRWGDGWWMPEVLEALERRPAWIWAAHLETSTGVLNDINALMAHAAEMGCGVALDCVSSVGAVRIRDEAGSLLMASGVSGKSIGSYAGLAFVGVNETARRLLRQMALPPSFDLTRMLDTHGPVSTVPSPLLYALSTALQHYGSAEAVEERFREYARLGLEVRRGLRAAGITPLAKEWHAAPNITTFLLPHDEFADECSRAGFQIAHESGYLATRGWGQVATMGNISREEVKRFFAATGCARSVCSG